MISFIFSVYCFKYIPLDHSSTSRYSTQHTPITSSTCKYNTISQLRLSINYKNLFTMFTKSTTISALAGLAAAAPTHPTPAPSPNIFSVTINRSGSPIQFAGVSAKGYSFNVNNGTGTFCPSGVTDCSTGKFKYLVDFFFFSQYPTADIP